MAEQNATPVSRTIAAALAEWSRETVRHGAIIVPTHCLYGSNAIVRVTVSSGGAMCVVHDDGGALDEFAGTGGVLPKPILAMRSFLRDSGLLVSNEGAITAPPVPLGDVAPTIVLVANASKEAADMLLDRWSPKVRRDFKGDLMQLLQREFPERKLEREARLAGASTKQHRFDFAVPLHAGRLVIDAVSNEPSSISAAVVKSIDVARAGEAGVELRLVYDDRDEWRGEDLNLLKLGARPIAYTHAHEAFSALAA